MFIENMLDNITTLYINIYWIIQLGVYVLLHVLETQVIKQRSKRISPDLVSWNSSIIFYRSEWVDTFITFKTFSTMTCIENGYVYNFFNFQ